MTNQEHTKAAARRMTGYLAERGIAVPHTMMLEALAKGFGLDNWRTLRAVIDAPRQSPTPKQPSVPALGTLQTWTVEALYLDNDQQYGDYFDGRTPLEAAFLALVDRETDFCEIGILSVCDAAGKCHLSPSFATDLVLEENEKVFQALHQMASTYAEPEHEMAAAIKWLGAVLEESSDEDMTRLTDASLLEEAAQAAEQDKGSPENRPTQVLVRLCDWVETKMGGVIELEKADEALASAVHQVRAICECFGPVIDSEDGLGFINPADFE